KQNKNPEQSFQKYKHSASFKIKFGFVFYGTQT
ncbi:uncharacterized protein METZ01_LOCUS329156, partial [marine metagenome]